MSPRIVRVHPLAGVEGGRVTILGEDLLTLESGSPAPYFDKASSRPLIAAPDRIVCPVPEGAVSGFLRVAWSEAAADGPYFEVAAKLADELHPVANPVVDREGYIVTTFSGSRGQAAPNGVSVFRIPNEGGAEAYISNLMNPTGLAVSPDGTLFVSCRNDGTVRRVVRHGETELFSDGLGIATGIAFDQAGTLFVGDRSGGIFAVEPRGSTRRFARLPASVAAYHLAFGSDGDLYVTAPTLSNDDPIFRVTPAGKVRPFFEHLARPQGLTFDRDGNLFVVAIYGGERGIFRITAGGEAALAVAGENLVGLTFDGRGRMIIASTGAIFRLGWEG
ncbi:MAG: gluconolaconase [candidate division NC10 bacterium]|nr:gluconolaconase [candidate division NC10 bacterium]